MVLDGFKVGDIIEIKLDSLKKELVIGYDCRTNIFIDEIWTVENRELYLLRTTIKYPKSVDDHIWPSVLEPSEYWPFLYTSQFPAQCFAESNTRIAITIVNIFPLELLHSNITQRNFEQILNGYMKLDPPDPKWKFLGFDIADSSFVSGLSNCGYSAADKIILADYWFDCINENGLISRIDDAILLHQITSIRVREHNPFSIYGIYQLD